MNVSYLYTKEYKYFIPLAGQNNKPNSNPIKPNFRKAKMNVNSIITKDYRKKDDFKVRINKPNFRKAKNERKLTYNKGLQKKRCYRSPKNKPNSNPIKACPERTCPEQGRRSRMGQFHLPQRHALSYAEGGKKENRCRFSEVRYLSSAFCFLSSVPGHRTFSNFY